MATILHDNIFYFWRCVPYRTIAYKSSVLQIGQDS